MLKLTLATRAIVRWSSAEVLLFFFLIFCAFCASHSQAVSSHVTLNSQYHMCGDDGSKYAICLVTSAKRMQFNSYFTHFHTFFLTFSMAYTTCGDCHVHAAAISPYCCLLWHGGDWIFLISIRITTATACLLLTCQQEIVFPSRIQDTWHVAFVCVHACICVWSRSHNPRANCNFLPMILPHSWKNLKIISYMNFNLSLALCGQRAIMCIDCVWHTMRQLHIQFWVSYRPQQSMLSYSTRILP